MIVALDTSPISYLVLMEFQAERPVVAGIYMLVRSRFLMVGVEERQKEPRPAG